MNPVVSWVDHRSVNEELHLSTWVQTVSRPGYPASSIRHLPTDTSKRGTKAIPPFLPGHEGLAFPMTHRVGRTS